MHYQILTLRDLKPKTLRSLQSRCMSEYESYSRNRKHDSSHEEVWQRAWSDGLKAGLEHSEKEEPKP